MFEFDAHFYETKIFIGGKKEYTLGEILEKYLSKNIKGLEELHHKCKRYVGLLHYPEDMSEVDNCDRFFQEAICFYNKMDDLVCSLPPYNAMDMKRNRLFDLLNNYQWVFDNEPNHDPEDKIYPEYNDHFYVQLPLSDFNKADMLDDFFQFNATLKAFAQEYLTFI